jgi:hypothetical protein
MASDLDKVVDKFSGFITKEQAEYIMKAESDPQSRQFTESRKSAMSVKELLSSFQSNNSQKPLASEEYLVNVKDTIYRIFNPVSVNARGRETTKRIVILGEEGSTIVLNLKDKLSEFIDINTFERGDMVIVNNVLLDSATGELKSTQNSVINRVSPSKCATITDYSNIKNELRKVDILARIVEISPIKHVTRLGKAGRIAVASCVVTDSVNLIDASFWGSSAITTAKISPNDVVKVEFCDIRMRDGAMQIYVNDDSRVLVSGSLSTKIAKR